MTQNTTGGPRRRRPIPTHRPASRPYTGSLDPFEQPDYTMPTTDSGGGAETSGMSGDFTSGGDC